MTDTLTISDLRALKLTENEWSTLHTLRSADYDQSLVGGPMRADVDMLVLSGLVERISIHPPEWAMTDEGIDAANAIDLVFDWADFAHVEVA